MGGGRTIAKWCRDNSISRSGYYNGEKRKDDSVPAAIYVGGRRVITDEEDAAWRERRQAKAEQERNEAAAKARARRERQARREAA